MPASVDAAQTPRTAPPAGRFAALTGVSRSRPIITGPAWSPPVGLNRRYTSDGRVTSRKTAATTGEVRAAGQGPVSSSDVSPSMRDEPISSCRWYEPLIG